MKYTTFNKKINNPEEQYMFFSDNVNVSRGDIYKHKVFQRLTELQLGFFWRPEEVDISKDKSDWNKLNDVEKHIFLSNIKYQTLLDSIAARSVNAFMLPVASLSEVETWIETHAFSETIHYASYTYLARNVFDNPSVVFDDIVINPAILKRAESIAQYVDDYIFHYQIYNLHGEGTFEIQGQDVTVNLTLIKEKFFLAICALNSLESIRFYVSFACSFAFAERELMEGNQKIIRLIARDEANHNTATQQILNLWESGKDDPEMQEIAIRLKGKATQIFLDVVQQEKDWADYLFKDGSMIGLNAEILKQYIEYIATIRMEAVNLESPFTVSVNPIPWVNSYLYSDNVQVAPQEAEIASYLVGQVDSAIDENAFESFSHDF